jgi:hypothetical protein
MRHCAIPKIDDQGVLVRVLFNGICGSDLEAFRARAPFTPARLGREVSGVIAALGALCVASASGSASRIATCGARWRDRRVRRVRALHDLVIDDEAPRPRDQLARGARRASGCVCLSVCVRLFACAARACAHCLPEQHASARAFACSCVRARKRVRVSACAFASTHTCVPNMCTCLCLQCMVASRGYAH